MTKEPIFIDEHASIEYAEEIMKKNEITCLLIQENEYLKGVIHIGKC